MKRVIVDIGSGKTKAYIIDQDGNIIPLYNQRIRLKEGYNKALGLNLEQKACLFDTVNKIKMLAEGNPISIYATSVFRTMERNILLQFIEEFETVTGLRFEVITHERESELMRLAVGNLELEGPYLVACIGNGSTEMMVMQEGVVLESVNIEFARADILTAFPELKNDNCNVDLASLEKYILSKMCFPTLPCKYAVILGFNNLTKLRDFNFRLLKNDVFSDSSMPVYLDFEQLKAETLKLLTSPYQKPSSNQGKVIDYLRAHCAIVKCILQSVQAKGCFPTNLNMIDGLAKEFSKGKSKSGIVI